MHLNCLWKKQIMHIEINDDSKYYLCVCSNVKSFFFLLLIYLKKVERGI